MTARCFINPADWSDTEIRLTGDEAHHLLHVLRARVGNRIVVFDGEGREAEAEVLSRTRDEAVLKVINTTRHEKPPTQIILIQAIIKGQRMDWILQKATEIGASVIVPVETEHGVVRIKPNQREERRTRWQRIVQNAAGQCGARWLTRVEPVVALRDHLSGGVDADLFLVCSLGEGARPLKDVLAETGKAKHVVVLVGPEGDLTEEEQHMAIKAGGIPVTLGSRTLRAETAGLYALSVLAYELGLER